MDQKEFDSNHKKIHVAMDQAEKWRKRSNFFMQGSYLSIALAIVNIFILQALPIGITVMVIATIALLGGIYSRKNYRFWNAIFYKLALECATKASNDLVNEIKKVRDNGKIR